MHCILWIVLSNEESIRYEIISKEHNCTTKVQAESNQAKANYYFLAVAP